MKNFLMILLAFVIVIKEMCCGTAAVGFKKLGNYYITDENENSNEKIYFLSMTFRANWMSAQSFCRSYGMDLVALESDHEAKYFMKACENNFDYFEEFSHIGAVSNIVGSHENWFWITSHKQVNFELTIKKVEADGEEKNCLQMVKGEHGFSFGRTNCFGIELQKFVCQRLIVKSDRWLEILGR